MRDDLFYSKEYLIESTHIETNKKLSLPAFFLLFQDLATAHANLLGLGMENTMDKGMLWVFGGVKFEFYDMPSYEDTIKMITYPGTTNRFVYNRYVEMRDLSDKVLARGSSTWLLIDEKTRKLITKPIFTKIAPCYLEGQLSLPERIMLDKDLSFAYEKDIMYSDCDLNSHLNNTRYIELIVNVNHLEFYKEYQISSLLINYLKEIKDGQHIKIFTNKEKTQIRGLVDDIVCFEAILTYKKR